MTENSITACYIQSIGTAVPEQWLDCERNEQLLTRTCTDPRTVKLFRRIARLTGIEKRHLAALDYVDSDHGVAPLYRSAGEQPCGPGMGARTAIFQRAAGPLVARALGAFSNQMLAQVGALVTVSCTHASSPGLELPIFSQSPVSPSVHRWNLGFMGCSAGLAAMRLVHQTNIANNRLSLIVACELSSLHFQYSDELDQMTANLLFADGAAAMLLSSTPTRVRIVDCVCAALPAAADQMVWFAGDYGLQLRLSQDLPDTLASSLPHVVAEFLHRNGIPVCEVDHWLVHPGGPQILDSVEASLGLPKDSLQHSRSVFKRYGNMSSPTIFFIMKELFESKALGRVVAVAFGPGLTIELVLLQVEGS